MAGTPQNRGQISEPDGKVARDLVGKADVRGLDQQYPGHSHLSRQSSAKRHRHNLSNLEANLKLSYQTLVDAASIASNAALHRPIKR